MRVRDETGRFGLRLEYADHFQNGLNATNPFRAIKLFGRLQYWRGINRDTDVCFFDDVNSRVKKTSRDRIKTLFDEHHGAQTLQDNSSGSESGSVLDD